MKNIAVTTIFPKRKKMKLELFLFIYLILAIAPQIYAYNVEQGQEVHQYITNESKETWKLMPTEVKQYLKNPLNRTTGFNFDQGDDLIDGSREEDALLRFLYHFWQPDDPKNGKYNDGLTIILDSSWERAKMLWKTKVIPNYLKGNVNESYYYLGRVAHLLEDAAQPSHVHLDAHGGLGLGGNSILEDYTGSNFSRLRNTANWQGKNFNLYYYEYLIDNFNWSKVEPKDKEFMELFRLFWYTAQKTQYWASDDVNGNTVYTNLNGNTQNWQCSGSGNLNLWKDFNYTSCNNFTNDHNNLNLNTVDQEANATIPHAMKGGYHEI